MGVGRGLQHLETTSLHCCGDCRFQLYVEKCFVDAERGYQEKSRDEKQNPLTGYDGFPSDYEGRFVVQLLKVLPD